MNGTSLVKAFVGLPAGAAAVYNSSGLAYYRHADWLGSSRFASTPSRAPYYDGAYAPFGEPYAQNGTADLSFTGMNQDTLANLYDFPAREYGTQGRWPSPDPADLAAADPTDPQTWNRYAYVRNSPLNLTDPLGLDPGEGCIYMFTEWGYFSENRFIPFDWMTDTFGSCNTFQPWLNCHSCDGEGTGGGGGGGRGTLQTQGQTPQQTYDSCMAGFNNSSGGKVSNFFSLAHAFDSLTKLVGEWLLGPVSKAAVVQTVAEGGVHPYGLLNGSAPLSTAEIGAKALGVAGTLAVAAGTFADLEARSVCTQIANPGMFNPQSLMGGG